MLQYGGSLLAAAATPCLADLHQLMREQVGWPDSWGLDIFAETWTAGTCNLRLLNNQAPLSDLGLRHGAVLCCQRSRQDPQARNCHVQAPSAAAVSGPCPSCLLLRISFEI